MIKPEASAVQAVLRLVSGQQPDDHTFSSLEAFKVLKYHKLLPIASLFLKKIPRWENSFDQESLQKIHASTIPSKAKYTFVIESYRDAHKILNEFKPLLIKGIGVAQVYPEPWVRDPGDLDIIVQKKDHLQASTALLDSGWTEVPTVHWEKSQSIQDKYGFARVFKHPENNSTIDLHRDIVDRTEPFPMDSEFLFRSTRKISVADNLSIDTPSREVHFAVLALHSVRHGFFRIQWFLDLHFACQKWQKGFRFDRFYQFCRKYGILSAVQIACAITQRQFGTKWTPVPANHMVFPKEVAVRRRCAALGHGKLVKKGGIRRISAMADLFENPVEMFNYLRTISFPPRDLVLENSGLPLSWIRYFTRRNNVFLNIISQYSGIRRNQDSLLKILE